MYPDSALGFLYLKPLRPYYKLGLQFPGFSKLRALLKSKYFKEVQKLQIDVPPTLSKQIKNKIGRFYLITVLLELGKLSKKKLIQETGTPMQLFIDAGYSNYLNRSVINLKLEDLTYFWSLCSALDAFVDRGYLTNLTVIRDATASTAQH
jgi:hypothetical protein